MYISGQGKQADTGKEIAYTLCHNDHRIAMSLYIASLFTDTTIKIDSIKCINKSFPAFGERLSK